MKEISTLFKDAVCPEPGPKTAKGTSFGKPLSEGPGPTPGVIEEVQFCDYEGSKAPAKISGGGSY